MDLAGRTRGRDGRCQGRMRGRGSTSHRKRGGSFRGNNGGISHSRYRNGEGITSMVSRSKCSTSHKGRRSSGRVTGRGRRATTGGVGKKIDQQVEGTAE